LASVCAGMFWLHFSDTNGVIHLTEMFFFLYYMEFMCSVSVSQYQTKYQVQSGVVCGILLDHSKLEKSVMVCYLFSLRGQWCAT
jgi:hypothetical protein